VHGCLAQVVLLWCSEEFGWYKHHRVLLIQGPWISNWGLAILIIIDAGGMSWQRSCADATWQQAGSNSSSVREQQQLSGAFVVATSAQHATCVYVSQTALQQLAAVVSGAGVSALGG
jgi:hypothetical protein